MNKQTSSIRVSAIGIVAAAMFLFGMPNVQAQEAAPRHEVTVAFQGLGLGSMPFQGASWNDQPGLTLGVSAGYTYWFNEHMGIHTGLRLNDMSHNQKVTNYNVPFSTTMTASSIGLPSGSGTTNVNLLATATSIQEEQHYNYVELPIQLALQFNKVFVNVGISLAKAVRATADYSYTNPTCAMTEFPDFNITPTPAVPLTLTGETSGSIKNADMVKPLRFLLDAEAGYKIPLGDITSLGVGVYGRFSPIPYKNNDAIDGFAVQPDATYSLAQPSITTLGEKVGYYEVGVSVGMNFGLTKNRKKSNEYEKEILALQQTADEYAANLAAERNLRSESEKARQQAEAALASERNARQQAEAALNAERENRAADRESYGADRQAPAADRETYSGDRTAQSKEPTQSPVARMVREEVKKKLEAINATVYFASAGTKAQFDSKTDEALHAIAVAMNADNSLKANVTGHADNIGSAEVNMRYGQRRAEALKAYLVKLGAPAANINCESKGEEEPVADNGTEEGRALNRRATVALK